MKFPKLLLYPLLAAISIPLPLRGATDPGHTIRVALYQDTGSMGEGLPKAHEQLGNAPGIQLTSLTAEQIRAGGLDGYDVVVFTGGSATKQGGNLGDEGRAKIKTFVENGGGYVGICAGAYLACDGTSAGRADLLAARTKSAKWRRGKGIVKLELTEDGQKILGDHPGQFDCLYHNGPIIKPADNGIEPFVPLAIFRTEVAENDTPPGIMTGAPAIVRGLCGKGKVIAISPHPEQTPGLEDFLPRAVRFVDPKNTTGEVK